MGEVYLAHHPRLPRRNALKVLPADVSADAEYRARFNREADLASTLWHPHIVSVHDRGEYNGQLWISMDYIDGQDAARLLADRYPAGMPIEQVVRIVTSVASALDYAHKQGLLHRDVKPANIMLSHRDDDDEQRILLADFGIARDIDEISGLTTTNMAVGTVAYAAPEQLMGEEIDGRADQYALSATAYHLLTGFQLFPYSNPAVVISRHLNEAPPTLADTRPELASLDPVLAAALAKDPSDRFRRCLDFARALTEQAAEGPSLNVAPTASAVPTFHKDESAQCIPARVAAPSATDKSAMTASRKRWTIPAALATVLLFAVIALTWHPWQHQNPGTTPLATSITPTQTIAQTVSPTVTVAQSQSEVEPKTLEAATAAEQEKTDRFASGDFAGEWLLFSRQLRDAMSQDDYVTYAETCWKSPLGMTVTGVRMEGDSKAIVRGGFSVVMVSYTMVYEDGKWYQEPVEDLAEELGKPVEQMIAAAKAKGGCTG